MKHLLEDYLERKNRVQERKCSFLFLLWLFSFACCLLSLSRINLPKAELLYEAIVQVWQTFNINSSQVTTHLYGAHFAASIVLDLARLLDDADMVNVFQPYKSWLSYCLSSPSLPCTTGAYSPQLVHESQIILESPWLNFHNILSAYADVGFYFSLVDLHTRQFLLQKQSTAKQFITV